MFTASFLHGFTVTAPLIMAIGAQNLFVLRQGALGLHIAPIVLFCAAMDTALVTLGVKGLGAILGQAPSLQAAMALAGSAFLFWYASQAARRAMQPAGLVAGAGPNTARLGVALTQAAAFTFLNPHVYLDTVLLVGAVGAAEPAPAQPWFVAGAALSSLCWFTLLGFGAHKLAPVLARPKVWRTVEAFIAVTMVMLASLLAKQAITALT